MDARKVGANMTAFVAITTPEHSTEWLEEFHTAVSGFPEVVEFYRMSGQVDYLLRVVVPDIDAYDAFYKKAYRFRESERREFYLRHRTDQVHQQAACHCR